MITFDFETCGFHGVPVFLQWMDREAVQLCDLWMQPVRDTLDLITWISEQGVCGFNLAFDWFHMQKLFSMFSLAEADLGNILPVDHINAFAYFEKDARLYPYVIKPKAAMDVMLHARKGPYQSLMARKDIRIRKVPVATAVALQEKLERTVEIDGIYFSRRKDKYAPSWKIEEYKSAKGERTKSQEIIDNEFRDIVLKFAASGALKVLAEHALKIEPDKILSFADIDCTEHPEEEGWAPFALAISKGPNWRYKDGFTWPRLVLRHIRHWAYNSLARKYGSDDVIYTKKLWEYFGRPEIGDDDSELACMVGACRWRGFKVNTNKLKRLRTAANKRQTAPQAPAAARKYISELMDDIEIAQFSSTSKEILEEVAKWECNCAMEDVDLIPGIKFELSKGECLGCNGTGKHPAAARASEVLISRKAKKEADDCTKLIKADRLHADFNVIGTLSSRMSGTGGLNAQAINRRTDFRECFDLADQDFVLCGGDFDAFEVVLALAAYPDKALEKQVKSGKKIHGLFAIEMFPDETYETILASKGQAKDMYTLGKNGVFSMIYGGNWATLVNKYGVEEEVAQTAEENWNKKYPEMYLERQKIFDQFCSMKQEGIGKKVSWSEPADYAESLFGFKRYFTLENKICKSLFNLANSIPKEWSSNTVIRRDRVQTAKGATSSALYAAAFNIQSSAMRAAANHRIQSSGATVTKNLQRKVWDIQPTGVSKWRIYGMNIHDEIMLCVKPEYQDLVEEIVNKTVESFKSRVPLIKFEFQRDMGTWAEK